ncbi:MAG: L-aspartate oxidase [Ardenticatenaceae bacterium]
MKIKTVESDIIIIGGGLAGLYAALHAPDARVALLSKGKLSVSNSMWAQGGIAAALAPDDSPRFHLEDTLNAGRGLCSRRAVEVLVNEGPACIHHLLELGVPFDYEDGELALGMEGGHGMRRVAHAGGVATGAVVTGAVADVVREQANISLYEETMALELLLSDGDCVGVLARQANEWLLFRAPATILACGGIGGLYARTTNPAVTRGDGIAMAYRAGAAVADMEFVQFHPTAFVPRTGDTFLLSEAIRGEGAHLLNVRGERFMERLHPRAELAPRDVVARAILGEMESTKSTHVLLDLSPIKPQIVRHHFAMLYERSLKAGFDMLQQPMPVAPAAHYMMGGVCTDLNGATTVPGLFACGEVACTGVQGANRLASNSLLECLVFGRRSAFAAQRAANTANQAPRLVADASAALKNVKQPSFLSLRCPELVEGSKGGRMADRESLHRVGHLLWNYAGLVRHSDGLRYLLSELEQMAVSHTDYLSQNAILVAQLIATAALRRTESRGGHYRADFPQKDPAWRKRILFRQGHPPTFIGLQVSDLTNLSTAKAGQ